jgi:hypothetical protein
LLLKIAHESAWKAPDAKNLGKKAKNLFFPNDIQGNFNQLQETLGQWKKEMMHEVKILMSSKMLFN